MKHKISKEWCQKMGEVEDGMDIAAGGPNHPLRLPRPEITDSEDNPSEAPSNPGSKEAVMTEEIEKISQIVFEAMRFEREETSPKWVEGGNSFAQVEARKAAHKILAAQEDSRD